MGRGTRPGAVSAHAALRDDAQHYLHPDPEVAALYGNLARMNIPAYDVGGGPRADVYGVPANDRDFAAAGISLDELKRRLKAEPGATVSELVVVTDYSKQTIGYRFTAPWTDPEGIEIVLPRQEVSTGPRHQDFELTPISVEEYQALLDGGMTETQARHELMKRDALRRDWTVNATMVDIRTGEKLDPLGGLDDMRDLVLRPVSPDTCRDDPMRTIRGISRISQDFLTPTPEAEQQLRDNAGRLQHLTQDKVFKELTKTLKGRNVGNALRFACDTGVLQAALPEFADSVGYNQMSPFHPLTAHEHMILGVQRAVDIDASMEVRWAMLMHDVGKAKMGWTKPGEERRRFYANPAAKGTDDPSALAHEEWSEILVKQALGRSQMHKNSIARIALLTREHMFHDDDRFEERTPHKQRVAARSFIMRVGPEAVEDLLAVRFCDRAAKDPSAPTLRTETQFERVVRQEMRSTPMDRKELPVAFAEMLEAGVKPGPEVTDLLKDLLQQVHGAEDVPEAIKRSGLSMPEIVALRGDKERFRQLPLIERWTANGIVKAKRKQEVAAQQAAAEKRRLAAEKAAKQAIHEAAVAERRAKRAALD